MTFDALRSPADVDAAWLTAVLHGSGIGVSNEVEAFAARSIGTGQVGENVRFELMWRDPDDALPATVVGKFPSTSELSRATAVQVDTYTKEVGFYRDLRPLVSIRSPDVLHVGWDPATHDFVIVMEDIAPAIQGDQIAGCGIAEAKLAIDQAVGLHGPTWGRIDDLASFDWLGRPDREGLEFRVELFRILTPSFLDRFRQRLTADDRALATVLIECLVPWYDAVASWSEVHGACVTHGDYRLDNMLFGSSPDSPELTVVDWQTVTVGIGPADVAYFVGAGLRPADRSVHERPLVERYAAGLRGAGVTISDEAAWDGYVLGSVAGYHMAVLASQIVERTQRGDEMFAVMAERHADQIRSVGLLDVLGVT